MRLRPFVLESQLGLLYQAGMSIDEMILGRGTRQTQRMTYHSTTLSSTNTTWSEMGLNTRLGGKKLATIRLNFGTV